VCRPYPFGERLFEVFDRVALVQCAERGAFASGLSPVVPIA
jgi:hypothetical protein